MEVPISLLVMILILFLTVVTRSDDSVFNVLNYGAVGNGQTDDTNAFAKAWQATCESDAPSPIMRIPSNKEYFIQPLRFEGPCKSKSVIMEIDGNLVAPSEPSNWKCLGACNTWLYFHGVDGLNVRGHGVLHGHGEKWWHKNDRTKPTALEISNSNHVFLGGLGFKNNPHVHVVLKDLDHITVSNITIEAPGNSPNTDGIHVTTSTNVIIDHCRIGTGDDCISIVDGSSYITISNVICGPGHGISVGSLGKNGANDKVEYVKVSDSVFIGATNGVRIKTWQGGNGYARHMLFERILTHDTINPIIIDQFYCFARGRCITSESAVEVKNITYRQILGTTRKKKPAVRLACSAAVPCKDIVFEDMHIVSEDSGKDADYECINVHGSAHGEIFPRMSCLY